jgi:hypothetical protein
VALVGCESCFAFHERHGGPSLNAFPVVSFSEARCIINEAQSSEALRIEIAVLSQILNLQSLY